MSVGGKVCEVIDTGENVWVDTREREGGSTTAIYVERTDKALCISEGDTLWWQGGHAYWTPKKRDGSKVGPVEVKLKRIGFSGVSRPKGSS